MISIINLAKLAATDPDGIIYNVPEKCKLVSVESRDDTTGVLVAVYLRQGGNATDNVINLASGWGPGHAENTNLCMIITGQHQIVTSFYGTVAGDMLSLKIGLDFDAVKPHDC